MAESSQLQIQVPDDLVGGVYANMALVWHTPYEFTIDFAALQPTIPGAGGDQLTPARVVSRVKFPPAQVFQLLQAINANMTKYEEQYGPIPTPGQQPEGD